MTKPLRDIILMLYDDLDFKAMSLPRVILALSFALYAAITILIMFVRLRYRWDFTFPYYPELTGFCTAMAVPYCAKKLKGGPPPQDGGPHDEDNS